MLADPAVLEVIDLESMLDGVIACSSVSHAYSVRYHGDPDLPAEFMVRFLCTYCGQSGRRPVCRYFATITVVDPTISGVCKCGATMPLPEAFIEVTPL